jgi:hypothetical protein
MTIRQMAELALSMGIINAINLDGTIKLLNLFVDECRRRKFNGLSRWENREPLDELVRK